jgi:hypothetical protein
MAWFALARFVIVAAVAYAAALLRPLPIGLVPNVVFAAVLGGLVVAFEREVRETAPSRILGALIGCATAWASPGRSKPACSGRTAATLRSSSSTASC